MEHLELALALEVAADFADIISVKLHDFALGDPEQAQPLPPRRPRCTTRRGARSRSSIPREISIRG